MLIDVAVVAAALFGAFVGWRRGFILPLIAVATTYLALSALYTGPGADVVPSGTAGIGAGLGVVFLAGALLRRVGGAIAGIVHRFAPLKKADQALGVPLGAATALVAAYLVLAAVLRFDAVIAPFHGDAPVDTAAVAAVRAGLAAHPQYAVLMDPKMLDELAVTAARSAIPRDQLTNAARALALYEEQVRPQLLKSVVARSLVAIGERLPFIGRHVEFPTE